MKIICEHGWPSRKTRASGLSCTLFYHVLILRRRGSRYFEQRWRGLWTRKPGGAARCEGSFPSYRQFLFLKTSTGRVETHEQRPSYAPPMIRSPCWRSSAPPKRFLPDLPSPHARQQQRRRHVTGPSKTTRAVLLESAFVEQDPHRRTRFEPASRFDHVSTHVDRLETIYKIFVRPSPDNPRRGSIYRAELKYVERCYQRGGPSCPVLDRVAVVPAAHTLAPARQGRGVGEIVEATAEPVNVNSASQFLAGRLECEED
jgi:hypothetical protein